MSEDTERRRLLLGGAMVIVSVGVIFSVLLMLRTKLSGVLGEWAAWMMGVLTTPFLMEAFFLITGFLLVVWINHRRRVREGEDFVDLARFDEERETREDAGNRRVG